MDKAGQVILAIFGGIITLAVLAVIVSKRAQTPEVIQAASSALANVVGAAVAPITTAATNGNAANNTFATPSIMSPIFGDYSGSPVFAAPDLSGGFSGVLGPQSDRGAAGNFLHNFMNPWR